MNVDVGVAAGSISGVRVGINGSAVAVGGAGGGVAAGAASESRSAPQSKNPPPITIKAIPSHSTPPERFTIYNPKSKT